MKRIEFDINPRATSKSIEELMKALKQKYPDGTVYFEKNVVVLELP